MVERRGEYAVRGGILDIFPPTEDHPLRCEFWGDEVTEIRWFAVADQRSLEIAEHGLWAPPCREILLDDAVRTRAAELVETLPGAVEMLDKLAAGIAVEGMESLAPVLVDHMISVLELVPDEALLVVNEAERVRRRAHDLVATTEEFLAAAWTGGDGRRCGAHRPARDVLRDVRRGARGSGSAGPQAGGALVVHAGRKRSSRTCQTHRSLE